jgi:hypothetical protein
MYENKLLCRWYKQIEQRKQPECYKKKVIICTLYKILLDDKIKEDAMGKACSIHAVDKKSVQSFGWKA